MEEFEIEPNDSGEYLVRVGSRDGDTSLTVVLVNAEEASEGRLTNDERTARATLAYLLRHQEASDLPPRIEIEDIIAAYTDAVPGIESLRD